MSCCWQVYREGLFPVAPLWNYCAVSLSNVVATFCQYEALKYVSFPVQTLGKCAKMIPVMVWGTFITGKTYKLKDYMVAVAVTLGCTVFILTGDVKSKASKSMELGAASLFGIGLMVSYLGFDGFTSTFQDRMFQGYSMTIYNQILYVTMCSSALSAFGTPYS
jgi:adenosine 3'-phospho 5'-phosphosulfate transporter B2